MVLTHGELFAGISGFGLGFERAGMVTSWAVEIEPDCRTVLRRHHPDTLIREDVREVGAHNLPRVDVISFGSPCQDLSVAGRRQGLDGARSGLFFEATRIIRELRPRYAIWENVPGALSSNGGRDFGAALDALADAGALDLCWRVLDAQWFGVAQRRRRVFLVASFAAGASAAEILFEPEGGSRNPPSRREAGEGLAASLTRGSASGRGVNQPGRRREDDVNLVPDWPAQVAPTLGTGWGDRHPGTQNQDWIAQKGGLFVPDVTPLLEIGARTNGDGDRDGDGIGQPGDPMYTLQASKQHGVFVPDVALALTTRGGERQDPTAEQFVAFTQNQRDEVRDLGDVAGALAAEPGVHQQNYIAFTNRGIEQDGPHETLPAASHGALPMVAHSIAVRGREDGQEWELGELELGNALRAGDGGSSRGNWALTPQMAVRRLTPTECERLQGFPDGWTEGHSDSARYRMLGNAVAVPCAEWIGRRILATA